MEAKRITINQWMRILNAFGLNLSQKTGGYCYYAVEPKKITPTEVGAYKITTPNGVTIFFMSGDLFYKTVRATEKSLKIALFK